MEKTVEMKKWIKGFLVFLVMMWICTIISKSIYVSKLPEVRVEKLSKRYIEHVVETDGIVTAGAKQAINTLAGLRVSEICVQEGDYVEKGDILFRIDLDDLSKMIAEKESELRKLQYQQADTQFNQILESQKKEIALLWAQEDYTNTDEATAIAVTRAEEAFREAENDLKSHLGTSVPHTSDEERAKAWGTYNSWKEKLYQAQDSKTEKERELSELNAKLESADALSEEELETLKTDIESVEKELLALTDELISLERNTVDMPDYSSEENEYDVWQEKRSTLEDAVHSAKQGLEDAKRNREDALREKLRATATAEVLSPSDSTASVQEIEIANVQKELSGLYAVRAANGEIKADKSGYLLETQIAVGNRTGDAAAMLLADEDEPYQFCFSITKEQGKYLHLDEKIELKIKGKSLEVNVDYIKENNAGGYDITCKLSDTIEKPGINGSIRKVEQGELHSITVPVEAIQEEAKSYYVYVLKEKTGILGKEYYVEKIKVSIADQNEKYASIEEGTIHTDTEVIISYSKEIKQGDSVRLAEE